MQSSVGASRFLQKYYASMVMNGDLYMYQEEEMTENDQ